MHLKSNHSPFVRKHSNIVVTYKHKISDELIRILQRWCIAIQLRELDCS